MNLIELETIDSTNIFAKKEAMLGAENGTIIWSHNQTGGKGRQGNEWVSKLGNLFMSIIFRPKVKSQDIYQLSFLTSVALFNVLKNILGENAEIKLKWPNDVLINEKKISGILLETESNVDWVVIGIGLNINSSPDGAISLYDLGFKNFEAKKLLTLIFSEIEKLLVTWEDNGFSSIRDIWLENAYKLEENITARLHNKSLNGIFKGLDENGCLQLLMNDASIKSISSGEIFYNGN